MGKKISELTEIHGAEDNMYIPICLDNDNGKSNRKLSVKNFRGLALRRLYAGEDEELEEVENPSATDPSVMIKSYEYYYGSDAQGVIIDWRYETLNLEVFVDDESTSQEIEVFFKGSNLPTFSGLINIIGDVPSFDTDKYYVLSIQSNIGVYGEIGTISTNASSSDSEGE